MSIQLGTIAGRHRRYLGPGKPRSAINCRSGTRLILDGNALLPGCPAGSGRAGERLRGSLEKIRNNPNYKKELCRGVSRTSV